MTAALSALNALAIDIMLPALPDIGRAFNLANDNDRQLVIVAYVALFGVAQLVYGPLADRFGRRSVLLWALAIFSAGTLLSIIAPTFELFLAARALQGVGAAAIRVISIAVVRDLTEGRRMAQIMSTAMTIFMIIPIVAPGIGQLILLVAPWRWIFGTLLIYALLVAIWALVRLPETLKPEMCRALQPKVIASGYAAVFRDRQTVGYMIASTFLTACLFGYITASEQIYVDVFALGPAFPIAFAAIAITISIGTFLNSRIVVGQGMRRISHVAMFWFTGIAALHALVAIAGFENFWSFIVLLGLSFGVFGLMSSNFNTLAMERMGHVAGSASAVFGAVTASGGAVLGGVIARAFDGTTSPFVTVVALAGVAIIFSVLITERGRLFKDSDR
ncbi:MAG: multidrug effflux MFS transporter [Hyphomonadaceae bacterium JAD_PAG50586_4]|nr:MAG: multidrug effflux MFS transporter [Hyphomonadaceae bacterium JAD_PAG50586_4]